MLTAVRIGPPGGGELSHGSRKERAVARGAFRAMMSLSGAPRADVGGRQLPRGNSGQRRVLYVLPLIRFAAGLRRLSRLTKWLSSRPAPVGPVFRDPTIAGGPRACNQVAQIRTGVSTPAGGHALDQVRSNLSESPASVGRRVAPIETSRRNRQSPEPITANPPPQTTSCQRACS